MRNKKLPDPRFNYSFKHNNGKIWFKNLDNIPKKDLIICSFFPCCIRTDHFDLWGNKKQEIWCFLSEKGTLHNQNIILVEYDE